MTSDSQLVGTWKLLSATLQRQDADERRDVWPGGPASGYMIFTDDGRVMVVSAGGGRAPGWSDEALAQLHRSMLAYTGRYRVQGDEIVTDVDVSWNEEWTGGTQRRQYQLDQDRLDIMSPWMAHPAEPEAGEIRVVLEWSRP